MVSAAGSHRWTAHPRSRGENEALAASDATDKGSSPLTRGKPASAGRSAARRGLIPAHAGKTALTRRWAPCERAHPRSRGENLSRCGPGSKSHGSSPLTRGKLVRSVVASVGSGLIPAHAGKTRLDAGRDASSWAHPRSRGENDIRDDNDASRHGSSPLTRGKLIADTHGLAEIRLIPAHAGKTVRRRPSKVNSRAHPRSRGENLARYVRGGAVAGSSPLTRGKLR